LRDREREGERELSQDATFVKQNIQVENRKGKEENR
jgi:hypothetical protein